jgi:hypothetical protein
MKSSTVTFRRDEILKQKMEIILEHYKKQVGLGKVTNCDVIRNLLENEYERIMKTRESENTFLEDLRNL